jgi:hypothetical protein
MKLSLTCIRNVAGSNIGQVTVNPDSVFVVQIDSSSDYSLCHSTTQAELLT